MEYEVYKKKILLKFWKKLFDTVIILHEPKRTLFTKKLAILPQPYSNMLLKA